MPSSTRLPEPTAPSRWVPGMVVEPYAACWLYGPGRLVQLQEPPAKLSAVASEKHVCWKSSQQRPNAQMFEALTAETVTSGRSLQLPLEPK